MKQLEVETYEHNGKPVCLKDLQENHQCIFLRCSHFGTQFHCALLPDESKTGMTRLFENKDGFISPSIKCPLHDNSH